MTCSYVVHLSKTQTIGVSDDAAGDARLIELYEKYGDCTVDCYDKNDIWGKGTEGVEPMARLMLSEMVGEM